MISEVYDITEIRLKILKELCKSPKMVKNLYWAVDSTWHNTYYHLKRLKMRRLVTKKSKGEPWVITKKGREVLKAY